MKDELLYYRQGGMGCSELKKNTNFLEHTVQLVQYKANLVALYVLPHDLNNRQKIKYLITYEKV